MMRKCIYSVALVLLFVASMTDGHSHEPVFTNVPNCLATKEYMPLCASDGNSYVNKKVFECANDRAGGSLTVSHEGPCEEDGHSHDDHSHDDHSHDGHDHKNETESGGSTLFSSSWVITSTFALMYINLK